MIKLKESRFLLAGAWNTFFGYFTSLLIYDSFHGFLHILLIGLMANILNISMSFLTYKFFVFRAKNHWLKEYLRSYIIYGGVALISLFILWFAVDYLKMPFWIAQALVMSLGVLISYIGHDRFTFKGN